MFIVNVVLLTNDLKLNVSKKFYSQSNRVMNYIIPQADRLKNSYRFSQEMQ